MARNKKCLLWYPSNLWTCTCYSWMFPIYRKTYCRSSIFARFRSFQTISVVEHKIAQIALSIWICKMFRTADIYTLSRWLIQQRVWNEIFDNPENCPRIGSSHSMIKMRYRWNVLRLLPMIPPKMRSQASRYSLFTPTTRPLTYQTLKLLYPHTSHYPRHLSERVDEFKGYLMVPSLFQINELITYHIC